MQRVNTRMENIQGETPTPNGETPGDTQAGADTQVEEAEAKQKPEGETPPDESKTEAEALREALRKEREKSRNLERAAAKQNRTVEERLAELESENQRLKIERLRDQTVDSYIKEVTQDGNYTVNRADVMELLEDVNLTEANLADAVKRRVDKLKQIKALETPEVAKQAISADKPEPSVKNPWAGVKL